MSIKRLLRSVVGRSPASEDDVGAGAGRLPALLSEPSASAAAESDSGAATVTPTPDEARPVGAMVLPLGAAPIDVETRIDEHRLRQLFSHTEATWTHLGETEPHWSVLSAERFKQDHLRDHREEFYASGRGDVELLLAFLARNGVATDHMKRVLEYGCGVGRVTRHLADHFEHVEACDISPSHLAQAQACVEAAGRHNVAFRRIHTLADATGPEDVDLVFSVIVLQHNPPPAILAILRALLGRLRPGGVGYFQLPTHAVGYEFRLDDYLSGGLGAEHIEMHYVPQRHVFEVIEAAGCSVLEVREDDWVGRRDRELSNTFLVRKR